MTSRNLNIMLATDYSDSVMNAERYAIQLAKALGASLSIIHIYDIPFNFPADPMRYADEARNLRKHELQKLRHHAEEIFHSLGTSAGELECDYIVREGNIGKEIEKEILKNSTDIIITGTHGAGGFRKFFLGSHTWDIIKRSTIPVLAYRWMCFIHLLQTLPSRQNTEKEKYPAFIFLPGWQKL
jgi:nucleotide-binding universal stress UspA family protein